MSKKHSVLMAQVNYQYGDNVFMPYSVACLQAYAQTIPAIREGFQFQDPLFLREDPAGVIRRVEEPSVACFSSYLWNFEYNVTLAQMVREAFPHCLIVFGGTHVPDYSEGFFVKHPYVDLLVHHEGEISFAAILQMFLSRDPDYTKIGGLSVRVEGDKTFATTPSARIRDLSVLPSPYLAGVFDFMLGRGYYLNATQETNRGCPFSCTFCDWGGSTYAKVFTFPEERLVEEFEWFGKNKVGYIFNGDANYGILKRDLSLTQRMVSIRAKHGGYPQKFRMCTAKNSNDMIYAIAKTLNDVGMSKGATLSFQSMDGETLRIVKRSNIKLSVFHELMKRYRDAEIPTYTELILGMPGETYESTKEGIDELFEGQADVVNLYVYVCTVLPNSEMSHPSYVEEHRIKSVRMPVLLAHSTPEPESIPEYQEVLVETATMSNEDWQRSYLFYWAVQTFHCLGLLQHIAILFNRCYGVKYSIFYEQLIQHFALKPDTLIGEQLAEVTKLVRESLQGGRLDRILPQFGGIYWPLDEASMLCLITNKEYFYQEVRSFLNTLPTSEPVDPTLLDSLVLYEQSLIKDPYTAELTVELEYDLPSYFHSSSDNTRAPLKTLTRLQVRADKCFDGDLEMFAREVVWYGRKGGRFHHSVTNK